MGDLRRMFLFPCAFAWQPGGQSRAGREAGTYVNDRGALRPFRYGGRDGQLKNSVWIRIKNKDQRRIKEESEKKGFPYK